MIEWTCISCGLTGGAPYPLTFCGQDECPCSTPACPRCGAADPGGRVAERLRAAREALQAIADGVPESPPDANDYDPSNHDDSWSHGYDQAAFVAAGLARAALRALSPDNHGAARGGEEKNDA